MPKKKHRSLSRDQIRREKSQLQNEVNATKRRITLLKSGLRESENCNKDNR